MDDPTSKTFPRYVYVPWSDREPFDARAREVMELARDLGAETGLPLLGVATTKNSLPRDWGKLPYCTRKSSTAASMGPAIEVHFWLSLDDFAVMSPLRAAHAFILEWASDDLSGWARHNHAVHFDTHEELTPALSPEAIQLYEQIDWNGNNGWHDAPGKRDALRDLRRLHDLNELDAHDLAGYMIGRHGNRDIRALLDLVKKVS